MACFPTSDIVVWMHHVPAPLSLEDDDVGGRIQERFQSSNTITSPVQPP